MKILTTISVLLLLTACSGSKLEVMRSPCAGAEDSPCGPKRPVNDWWMNKPESGVNV